ncbi:hypothetical protein HMPREF9244_00008 [Alloscardovia omnicolens F0580]|uniref:Uncharacterized protein n=2 Tax=Alloscardovia omnicolens TaxID=419015 RepID=U1SJM3_9BIFI|nr:hypothetical protein HMPREF9244_00008 [Alloscardovia omnicolens F0580]
MYKGAGLNMDKTKTLLKNMLLGDFNKDVARFRILGSHVGMIIAGVIVPVFMRIVSVLFKKQLASNALLNFVCQSMYRSRTNFDVWFSFFSTMLGIIVTFFAIFALINYIEVDSKHGLWLRKRISDIADLLHKIIGYCNFVLGFAIISMCMESDSSSGNETPSVFAILILVSFWLMLVVFFDECTFIWTTKLEKLSINDSSTLKLLQRINQDNRAVDEWRKIPQTDLRGYRKACCALLLLVLIVFLFHSSVIYLAIGTWFFAITTGILGASLALVTIIFQRNHNVEEAFEMKSSFEKIYSVVSRTAQNIVRILLYISFISANVSVSVSSGSQYNWILLMLSLLVSLSTIFLPVLLIKAKFFSVGLAVLFEVSAIENMARKTLQTNEELFCIYLENSTLASSSAINEKVNLIRSLYFVVPEENNLGTTVKFCMRHTLEKDNISVPLYVVIDSEFIKNNKDALKCVDNKDAETVNKLADEYIEFLDFHSKSSVV